MKPYLRVANVFEDRIDVGDIMQMHFGPEEFERYRLKPGDILLNEGQSPELLGRPALYTGNPPDVAFTNTLIRFRAKEGINPKWALLVFRHYLHSQRFMRESRITTNIAHLSANRFSSIEFPIPPFDEQRRIVEAIEEQMSSLDRAISRLKRLGENMRRFDEGLLLWACTGRLTQDWRRNSQGEPIEAVLGRVKFTQSATGRRATTDVIQGRGILSVGMPASPPLQDGWRWLPVGQVARLETGHTPSRRHPEYWNGQIPWIGIADAREHHGGRISHTKQTVSEAGIVNSSARMLPADTVCLSRTASVGYVVIMDRSMATSQDFVDWVCSEAIVPEFLAFALMAEGEEIRRFGRGTTHTTIYFPEVKAFHICLPPVAEQEEIVKRLEEERSHTKQLRASLETALRRAARLRSAILDAAFTGRLVPASVVLDAVPVLTGSAS